MRLNASGIILLAALLLFIGTANAQNITVNAEVEYTMKSLERMDDTFYLRFKNTNEEKIEVLDFYLMIPKTEDAEIIEVKDLPSGYVKVSDVVGDDGREYTMIRVTKTLTPFEEYQLTIKRRINHPVEDLGNGVHAFRAYEFPSYFRDFGLDVERFLIELKFPDSIFKNYNIMSTSSNTKFNYKSLNRIDSLEWDYVNPPNQIHVYVSFSEVPNFYLFNIMGAALTIIAFSALFIYSTRLERRLKKHEIVKNPPWSGDLLAKMK